MLRLKRLILRLLRAVLARHARAAPRPTDRSGAERRVTILLSSAWGMGGTIRATLNLAARLAADHEVEIVTVYRRREHPFFGPFPPGVTVTPLQDERPGHRPGPLERLLRSRTSALVHPHDRLAHTFNLWTDLRLVRLLRRRTGLLVTTRPAFSLLAAELRLPGLLVVAQEHTNLGQHKPPLRERMRETYGALDAIVVLTDRDERDYRALLGDGAQVHRIPNAVQALRGPQADLAARTVFTAGRLVWHKGYDLLVPAFARIAGAHPDWRLRISGDGYQRELLEALVAEHALEGRVLLDGPVRDIGTAMSMASVFVLSSRAEGFPLILLEAMSKGMAVASFDCPTGPAEIVEDRVNGLLVPALDGDALASALSELMADEALRRRCGAAAVATAARYSVEAVLPRWDLLLRQLWERRNGPDGPIPRGR